MKKLVLTLLLALTIDTQAQSQTDHWVGAWSTAPMAVKNAPLRPPAPPPGTQSLDPGIVRPSAPIPDSPSPLPMQLGAQDITLVQMVHVSLGGSAARVVFTNEYGLEPLNIGAASIATSFTPPKSVAYDPAPDTDINMTVVLDDVKTPLTFGGKFSITIPPGAIAVTDPVHLNVSAFSDLQISLFIPKQQITSLSRHTGALQSSYFSRGDITGSKPSPSDATLLYSWSFLKSVDVLAPANAGAVVAFGDSITDGAYATRDANARWPDDLARRLASNPATANLSVLNEGIGGNRVLHDNTGPSALARFTRDALDQAGVRYIIFLEAINDIGHAYTATNPNDVVSADDLIQGYLQMIDRAHIRGIKVIGATLTPYGGASYASPAGEQVRQAVNQWIRTTKALDGFIDFDKATQDPAHPDAFLPANDHGDHLHPTDAGYVAMSNSIDLNLFTK